MICSATQLFPFAQQYALLTGADFCEGLRAVAAGSDRAQAVGGPGDAYLLLTPMGWIWATEPKPEQADDQSDWLETRNYLRTCPL
ncbi:hypothetical protein [Fibrivirga algicola]|uniref:Uncharacterized protein n=1 Tax=Fibrivirga algicola TaxID=2950420 RepID=A0ABX0QBQ2_9BACT|nr:hypothetical protein [Fibrivirga algicola]NID09342.1 hypothetical protein [Fibrivirga algicola]